MSRKIPERYAWAVDLLDVQPDELILEIGCGYGHSIPLICEKLSSGKLTAIDRSAKMAVAALKAHTSYLADGKAEILHTDLLNFGDTFGFDKIFLFNINAFWMDPIDELRAIGRLLKPDGRFYIFHQPPPGHDLVEFERSFAKNLETNRFEILETIINKVKEVQSLCLVTVSTNRQ